MSALHIITAQPWLRKIASSTEHILIHVTSRERALSILQEGRIHGSDLHGPSATEAYPHFTVEGWPPIYNYLDVAAEITLQFSCQLPARYRGEGTETPERGWLEVYARGVDPWQCCLHPDSPSISFVGAKSWRPSLAWHDPFPFGRTLDAKLDREIKQATREQRKIALAFA